MESTKILTFRVRNIHQSFKQDTLAKAIAILFGLTTSDFSIRSLAFDAISLARDRTKVATVAFQKTPDDLKSPKKQWDFVIQLLTGDTSQPNTIYFDTTFESFTSVTPAENEDDTVADCILIHGWGSHAIGAFVSPDGLYLWPRDDLTIRHPHLRVWLYGYHSELLDESTNASIDDYADTFRRALQQARGSVKPQQPARPILFIVHSLGGWVFQHAMIDMAKSNDPEDVYNLQSTIGALYFGVPGQGMRVEEMATMIQNLPARYTANLLDKDLGFRQRAKFEDDFQRALIYNDITIFLFYEEEKTKTLRMNKKTQKWDRNGPPVLLVEPNSATYGRFPMENKISLRKNHIDMVKFNQGDLQYSRVIPPLAKLVDKALEVVAQNPQQIESDITYARLKQLTKEEQACLQSLAFPEMHYRKNAIREPADGTCVWLSSHQTYNEWLATKQGLLWISGKPGAGKSTLMAFIYASDSTGSHLNAITMSFFFHARGTEIQKSLSGFYRSMLHQLLMHYREGLSQSTSMYMERIMSIGEHWTWECKDLEATFQKSVVEAARSRPIRIYVDALDEAGEQNAKGLIELFKLLDKQAVSKSSQLAICFSCRHYPLLPIHDVPEICVERENRNDIDAYIKNNIDQKQRSRRSMIELELIRTTMLCKAEGSFQWVKVILDQIMEMHNHRESFDVILQAIKDSPEELDNLYRTLINQINERHRPQSLRLFKCVLFAKRPLSTEELRVALTLDLQHASIQNCRDSDLYQSINTGERLGQRIRFLSAGLIEIPSRMFDQENHEDLPESVHKIPYPIEFPQLIHQSAYDFLMMEGLKILEVGIPMDSSESPHGLLARLCLYRLSLEVGNRVPGFGAYSVMQTNSSEVLEDYFEREHGMNSSSYFLRYVDKDQEGEQHSSVIQPDFMDQYQQWRYLWDETALRDTGYPFFEYAVDFWSIHLRLAFEDPTLPNSLIELLCDPRDVYARCCKALQDSWRNRSIRWRTVLEFAYENGPHVLFTELLHRAADPEISDNMDALLLIGAIQRQQVSRASSLPGNDSIDLNTVCEDVWSVWARATQIKAASEGNDDPLQRIMRDLQGGTILLLATNCTIASILFKHGANPNLADKNRSTLLHLTDDPLIVSILLSYGADPHLQDANGRTPLNLAAKYNKLKIGELLLTHIQDKDKQLGEISNRPHWYPLNLALDFGHFDFVHLLAQYGADLTSRSLEGLTLLHSCVMYNQLEATRFLLKLLKPAAINLSDNNGLTALHYATNGGRIILVDLLLNSGADLSMKTQEGQTALHQAVALGHKDIAKLLLKHDADPLTYNANGSTPLHVAIKAEDTDLVCLLLENNTCSHYDEGNAEKTRIMGEVLYHSLTYRSTSSGKILLRSDIARLLLRHGARPNLQGSSGKNALHTAITKGRLSCVKLLLDFGADPAIADSQGRSAMHLAIGTKSYPMIEMLQQYPFSEKHSILATRRDQNGCTILHYAARRGILHIFQYVLGYCLKHTSMGIAELFNDTDYLDQDLLYHAILGHCHEMVQLLLNHEAISLSRRASLKHHSVLHLAVGKGCHVITKALLEYGFDTKSRDLYDRTPLAYLAATGFSPEHRRTFETRTWSHVPCQSCYEVQRTYATIENHYIGLVDLLLSHGADIYALDIQENTPRELALKRGNTMLATRFAELEKGIPAPWYFPVKYTELQSKSAGASQRVVGFDVDEAEEKIPVSSEDDGIGSHMIEKGEPSSFSDASSDVSSDVSLVH